MHLGVMFEFWISEKKGNTPSLPLLQGPLCLGVILPVFCRYTTGTSRQKLRYCLLNSNLAFFQLKNGLKNQLYETTYDIHWTLSSKGKLEVKRSPASAGPPSNGPAVSLTHLSSLYNTEPRCPV